VAKVRSWAGLDVQARSVLAVTLDAQSGELRSARFGRDREGGRVPGQAAGRLAGCLRGGADGVWARQRLPAAGIGCVVAAPGKIERPAQDKIKTDQRDAERVLRLLMIDAATGQGADRRGGGAARPGPRA
jgi:transposase